MDRAGAGASRGQLCRGCAAEHEAPPIHEPKDPEARCARCGGPVRGQDGGRVAQGGPEVAAAIAALRRRWAALGLAWRNWMLRLIERLYWAVTLAGTLAMLACGGFVPVMRAWLRNEIDDWSGVVARLGGLWFRVETLDPDSDLGPVLARVDAPQLFSTIDAVGRRLGVKPPGQVRLTYLPCCGVVAWGGSRALIIGLPLFRVLTQGELRAIVAHELAHLARGDATARPGRRGSSRRWSWRWSGKGRGSTGRWAPGPASACASAPGSSSRWPDPRRPGPIGSRPRSPAVPPRPRPW